MTQARKKGYAVASTDHSSSSAHLVMTDEYIPDRHGPATLTLDEFGLIRDCNKSGEKLFGCRLSELLCQHVSTLLPQLAEFVLAGNGQVNPRLGFLCHCGHLFQTHGRQGNTFFSRLNFVNLVNSEKGTIRLIIQPAGEGELQGPLL